MTARFLILALEIIGMGIFVYALICFGATMLLLHPPRLHQGFTPTAYGLPFRTINFLSADGKTKIEGWLIRHEQSSKGLIVFCHGLTSNKADFLPLAAFMFRNAYDCLLFDFRAHGASGGFLSNLGIAEKNDLLGAVEYVAANNLTPDGKVLVLGTSMGAAASVLAAADSPRIEGVVVDSSFSNGYTLLDENFSVHFHGLSKKFFGIGCRFFLDLLGGFKVPPQQPIDAARKIKVPILFIHGEMDPAIPPKHSELIAAASPSTQKSIWIVPGSGHVEGYERFPDEYQQRVLGFFDGVRKQGAAAPPPAHSNGVVEVAAGIVVDGGRILATRRVKGKHLEGMWEFPGGKVEPGESPQMGVIREIREEVDLEVVVENLLGTVDHTYPDRKVRIHFFKCRVLQGKAKPNACGELRWITKDEIDRITFPPANAPILPRVKEYLS